MSQQTACATGLPEVAVADTRSNFGRWGWTIILVEGLMLWISAGVQVHGLNIIVPVLSQEFAIEKTTLLFWATPASWGSVVAGYLCAKLVEWKGAKYNILLCLAACAVCFGLLGTWSSVWAFTALFCGVCFFGSGYAYVGGTALIANWFPRKKSLAFGWVTMGQTMSTALFVPMLALFFGLFGVRNGFWIVALMMGALIVLVGIFVTNTPEERGCTPDNVSMTPEELQRSRVEQETYVCPFTSVQLLGMRDVWTIGLGSGGIYVVLVGVLSQLVPRLMAMGYELNTAILYLAIAAFIGVPGAYLWGWLGQRLGTKAGLIVYSLWWGVAVVLNMFELNIYTLWASLLMIGLSFGGATNLTTSIVAEKFPRAAFITAFGVIQPIQGVVRCCAFAVLAFGLTYLGGYFGAYALLAGVAVINALLFWVTDTSPVT
ncbi:MFS transporter [Rhodoplanes sp. TEM]|uniref:MFS transporter n=1 Tax=Rhodoplanes tepidamans TaxID=200616 RepID=A0ABT5J498_RHOTP|nr:MULTISPECIES: MFS transporter [Rhodoplanes]MDC7784368.1 MFS transporter [Rhodoplanes tepidamans]MDC7983368.1 MFS transporter [Rhodoplanes sp. TEM]MDQ0354503.1 MFS family permease [Rhodoplanes tepidamans]